MGTVVEAYDPTLHRTVALKVLHRELAPSHGRRLLREARALAPRRHPREPGRARGPRWASSHAWAAADRSACPAAW